MNKKINFFDIPIDALSMSETINIIENSIKNHVQIHHSVVNASKVVLMQQDDILKQSVLDADLINADGQAVVWASNFLGNKIPERVAGIDLMENLVNLAFKKDYKFFFLGAEEKVVQELVCKYSSLYSEKIIAGYRNGYFNNEDEPSLVKEISSSKADLLFVAITSPKKEIFLNKYKNDFKNISFIMGVGGSFDAPLYMQRIGLEWLYRFLQEPRRMYKRYLLGNIKFIYLVLMKKFS